MTIAFILSMPGNNAWNGKWTGEGRCYAVVRNFTGKRAARLNPIVGRSFGYNFGDGWFARVEVQAVDGIASRRLRKATQGFCGYEWMIDSIISDGAIYGPTQPKPAVSEETIPRMTIAELYNGLEQHDWFHAMSDDPRVHQGGQSEWRRLQYAAIQLNVPELFTEYSRHVFSGPSFGTPKHPKPEMPKGATI